MLDLGDPVVAASALVFFVIGAVELVKQAFAQNWKAVVIIGVSALVGGFGGLLVLPVIGWVQGMIIGLSASGLVTTVQKTGQGTTPLPDMSR